MLEWNFRSVHDRATELALRHVVLVGQVVSAGSADIFVEDVFVDDLIFKRGLEIGDRLAIVEGLF